RMLYAIGCSFYGLRSDCHWRRPRRLCRRDPRRTTREARRLRGERAGWRHLSELGLHPDEIAPEQRRALPPDETSRGRLRLYDRRAFVRLEQDHQAFPRRLGQERRRYRISLQE